jgi:hypothetical protein
VRVLSTDLSHRATNVLAPQGGRVLWVVALLLRAAAPNSALAPMMAPAARWTTHLCRLCMLHASCFMRCCAPTPLPPAEP